ncbi:MAG TPA: cytochrome c [Gemmatimonadales bacterium]|nr:cytochrome c [Gemmatimonadales bacterium]
MRTKIPARAAPAMAVVIACLFAAAGRGATEPAKSYTQQPDTSAITPAMIDAGRRIFHGKGMCFGCHGMRLEGGPVAPPLGPHQWKDAKGGELSAIFYVDTHGVAGTVMISHPGGISDAEAGEVAAYIWAVSHRGIKP